MILEIFLAVIGLVFVLTAAFFVLRKYLDGYFAYVKEKYNSDKEVLDAKMQQGVQAMESKKDAIKEIIDRLSRDLQESKKQTSGEFHTLRTIIEEHKTITSDLKTSTDDLKNILSNNQLRGKYGEEVAENLLLAIGFVKGQHYLVNTAQETISTRPDFTILLPDKTKINIDAKFPFQSLLKYQEAQEKQEKEKYIKDFANDVKQKIKQVSSRDYINPQEKTVDFVILFIPNEMIFSFIYERLNEAWEEAFKKKVIMAGPFGFTAILRMIFQAYKNFSYQENLQDIIKLIKVFEQEYTKFSDELDVLGKRLKMASEQFDNVSTTRNKKLLSVVEKIKTENTAIAQEQSNISFESNIK